MVKRSLSLLLIGLATFAAMFIANVAIDPSFSSLSRDAGAFAYCGQQIDEGALLYRDCWDNKPPAIYYLDAAIIAIGGANRWSLWLFQAIWLSINAVVIYAILRRIWSSGPALLSTALFLFTLLYPVYFSGGNLTETYALLPITLTLGAYFSYMRSAKRIYLAGIGFFTAIAFLFKPTYISLALAISLIILFIRLRQRKFISLFSELGLMMASFIVPLLIVAAYWAIKKDLSDLLYAVFIHNRLYVQSGFSLRAVIGTWRILILEQPLAALFALTLVSLIVYFVENGSKLRRTADIEIDEMEIETGRAWVMTAEGIALLFDIIFITLPGSNFRHYYQIPILTMAIICTYLFYLLLHMNSLGAKSRLYSTLIFSAAGVLLLPWAVEVIGKELPSRANWQALISNPNFTKSQPDEIEKFILENSSPNQSILIWDYDPTIYFQVQRRSPTRFIFLRHIYTPIPGAANGFAEFMHELQDDPPVLIITSKTAQQGLPYLGLSEDEICNECAADIRQGVIEFKRYLDEYYRPYTDIQTWAIYKRIQ